MFFLGVVYVKDLRKQSIKGKKAVKLIYYQGYKLQDLKPFITDKERKIEKIHSYNKIVKKYAIVYYKTPLNSSLKGESQ